MHSSSSMDAHGYTMDTTNTAAGARIHHGYYIHSSMDTHGYIKQTTYIAATSCILHTEQQQHGFTWIHHGYYIHSSSSMDSHEYIMDTT
jgi:hypothetical protein